MRYKRRKYDQTIKIALYYWTSTQKNIPVDDRMKEVQIVFNWWFKSITKKKARINYSPSWDEQGSFLLRFMHCTGKAPLDNHTHCLFTRLRQHCHLKIINDKIRLKSSLAWKCRLSVCERVVILILSTGKRDKVWSILWKIVFTSYVA